MNYLKIVSVLVLLHLSIIGQAQLYAPEIKVQDTNDRIGIGTDNPRGGIDLKGIGDESKIMISNSNETESHWSFSLGQRDTLEGFLGIEGRDLEIYAGWDKALKLGQAEMTTYGGKVVFPGGNVGIGNYPNPSFKLQVEGQVASYGTVLTSDQRLKSDINSYSKGLEVVKKLNVKQYKYKPPKKINPNKEKDPYKNHPMDEVEDDFFNQTQIGVLAQEVQQTAPDLIGSYTNDGEEILTVNQTALTFILINAVKELNQKVELLEESLAATKKNE